MEAGGVKVAVPHPRARANPLSALTFWWMANIFRMGYRRDITVNDLFVPLEEHKSDYLGDTLERHWSKELSRAKESNRDPSFFRAIAKFCGQDFLFFGLLTTCDEILVSVAKPMLMGQLLLYFSPGSQMPESEAFLYASGMLLCAFINTMMLHPTLLGLYHLALKLRIASCSLLYRKALSLSRTGLGETTVGQVVNLMSNDVQRFDYAVLFFHYLWIGPVQTVVVAYLVWLELGIAGLGGILFMLLFIPLQVYFGKKMSVLRLRTALRTDERVRLMNEIISGIQVIKLYAWEMPFASLVAKARRSEIYVIRLTSYIISIIPSMNMYLTRFGIYLSILIFYLGGNTITAQKVFVITAYYNILNNTMGHALPCALAYCAEGWTSIVRLKKFLLYEELEVSAKRPLVETKDTEQNDVTKNKDLVIKILQGTAKWQPGSAENTLSNINLNVAPGQLVAVIGPVGAGKSSLLQAVLGELPTTPEGSTQVNGLLSYASQEPWLFSASLRQNILFGQPWNDQRYRQVLQACALIRDLEELPHGDQTLVGERGVVLSGGQRARVNLARAVYRDADIYLLDDPLSAVDTHVGKRLFDDCIVKLLKGKTCLLVTHQLQHLFHVDNLVILNNGTVEAQGTYSELQKTGLDFAQLLGHQEQEVGVGDVQSVKKQSHSSIEKLCESKTKTEEEEQEQEQELDKELRSSGHVQKSVYRSYFNSSGNCCALLIVTVLFMLSPLVGIGGDFWIAHWTNLEELRSTIVQNVSLEQLWNHSVDTVNVSGVLPSNTSNFSDGDWWLSLDSDTCLYIYSVLIVATILIIQTRSLLFVSMCMRASRRLHDRMFSAMLRVPMRFFNTNPAGRILNRFSKDTGTIDEILPSTMLDCFQIILITVGITVMVAVLNYWLLLPTLVIGALFYLARSIFLATSRSVKRLESVTRSPMFSHLSASLQGIATIRAHGAQDVLKKEFDSHQDLNTTAAYIFISANRAFGLWLDLGCVVYLVLVTYNFLLFSEGAFAGSVGLAITQSMRLMGLLQWGMRQSAELENQMTSVERVLEYSGLKQEPPLESPPGKKPNKEWPSQGMIVFTRVFLCYGKNEPQVLKDVSFTIRSMEKVGIVGRTGAGKSSLISALFRLTEIDGVILIDGTDTKSIGLHDLRGQLSIIPQDPVVFSGSLRRNLDPFNEYPDNVLWKALEEVELKEVVDDQAAGLSWSISEGGSNLSVGQRQLVCLARAIIRNKKILMLDEATANVDPKTDALIQKTIRHKFANCTVLTIAHRLHTVMDSDRILVLDAGRVVEFDQPHILLQNTDGFLNGMVQQLGKASAKELVSIAATNYNKSLHQQSS